MQPAIAHDDVYDDSEPGCAELLRAANDDGHPASTGSMLSSTLSLLRTRSAGSRRLSRYPSELAKILTVQRAFSRFKEHLDNSAQMRRCDWFRTLEFPDADVEAAFRRRVAGERVTKARSAARAFLSAFAALLLLAAVFAAASGVCERKAISHQ